MSKRGYKRILVVDSDEEIDIQLPTVKLDITGNSSPDMFGVSPSNLNRRASANQLLDANVASTSAIPSAGAKRSRPAVVKHSIPIVRTISSLSAVRTILSLSVSPVPRNIEVDLISFNCHTWKPPMFNLLTGKTTRPCVMFLTECHCKEGNCPKLPGFTVSHSGDRQGSSDCAIACALDLKFVEVEKGEIGQGVPGRYVIGYFHKSSGAAKTGAIGMYCHPTGRNTMGKTASHRCVDEKFKALVQKLKDVGCRHVSFCGDINKKRNFRLDFLRLLKDLGMRDTVYDQATMVNTHTAPDYLALSDYASYGLAEVEELAAETCWSDHKVVIAREEHDALAGWEERLPTSQIDVAGAMPFPCKFENCDLTFDSRQGRRMHKRSKHGGVPLRRYGCSVSGCSITARSNSAIAAHYLAVHLELRNAYRLVDRSSDTYKQTLKMIQEFNAPASSDTEKEKSSEEERSNFAVLTSQFLVGIMGGLNGDKLDEARLLLQIASELDD